LDHEIEHWNGWPRQESGSDRSSNERQRKPLKNGVGENDACADDHSCRGQQHGPEASRSGIDHRFGQRHSLAYPQFDEVNQNDRIAYDDEQNSVEPRPARLCAGTSDWEWSAAYMAFSPLRIGFLASVKDGRIG